MGDLSDHDQMIAARIAVRVGAFEIGDAAGEHRRTACARRPFKPGELVGAGAGEAVRDVFLIGGQHIDGVMAAIAEGGEGWRGQRDAPEQQRRLQRHGRKGVRRQPDRIAARIQRGDHGDAGGKTAEGLTQHGRAQMGGVLC